MVSCNSPFVVLLNSHLSIVIYFLNIFTTSNLQEQLVRSDEWDKPVKFCFPLLPKGWIYCEKSTNITSILGLILKIIRYLNTFVSQDIQTNIIWN